MSTEIDNKKSGQNKGILDLSGAGFLITSRDPSAYRAAMSLYDGVTSTELKQLLDKHHISQNLSKFIKNITELTSYVPGWIKTRRQKM